MSSNRPVELDGSTLEGGGQLVRVALALSAITGVPIQLYNIRANRAPGGQHWRTKRTGKSEQRNNRSQGRGRSGESIKVGGGLKESHLAAVLYLARKCNAYVEGAVVGSRELLFVPQGVARSNVQKSAAEEEPVDVSADSAAETIELKNPGSVWLILQALLPWMIFGQHQQRSPREGAAEPSREDREQPKPTTEQQIEVILKGGTNVPKSMSGEYLQHVLLPTLLQIGLPPFEVSVGARGWTGGAPAIGEVHIRLLKPRLFILQPFDIRNRGEIKKVQVKIVAGGDQSKELLVKGLTTTISEHFGSEMPIEFLPIDDSGDERRLYVLLVAGTSNGWRLGRDYLGTGRKPKNKAEAQSILDTACQTVVRDLKAEIKRGGCVDEFLQDQLAIFQALANGMTIVDGGAWKGDAHDEDEECGDEEGSLHTRTVRWVCGKMLRKQGLEFARGGVCQGVGWNRTSGDAVAQEMQSFSIKQ